jgi:hypothetical protein
MGIAHGDTDGDGVADLLVSHLVNEHDTLWRARPTRTNMFYRDDTYDAGLGLDSRRLTGWGCTFADFDHDGSLDLIVVNGHIRRESNQPFRYENPPILWHNRGTRFTNITSAAGPYFQSSHMARGLAAGDLDDDGDLDLVVVHHHKPSVVLWNESTRAGSSVLFDLRGAGANRDAIGATLVATAGTRTLVRSMDGGGSYISASDRRVHLGLGAVSQLDRVEIRWPSGTTEELLNLGVDRTIRLAERPGVFFGQ